MLKRFLLPVIALSLGLGAFLALADDETKQPADPPPPTFDITTHNAKVEVHTEKDIVIFNCTGDIGRATIRLKSGRWPLVVLVRIAGYDYVESFHADVDKKRLNAGLQTIGRGGTSRHPYVQVALPATALYRDQPKTLQLNWVDRFRH